ncbi:hypothetical protein KF728_20510 [Candidatus Obscuribacterales bacterium]|nr:hypothetical protein [Candidatus Obscuribacterales bacterium]
MTETNLEHGKGKRDGTGEPVRSGVDDEVLRQNRSDKVRGSFQNDGAISLPEIEPRKFATGEQANEAIDRSLANPSETNATKIERGVEQKSDLPSVVGSRNEPLSPALSAFQKEPLGELGNQGGSRVSEKPEGVNATATVAQEGLRRGKQTSNSEGSMLPSENLKPKDQTSESPDVGQAPANRLTRNTSGEPLQPVANGGSLFSGSSGPSLEGVLEDGGTTPGAMRPRTNSETAERPQTEVGQNGAALDIREPFKIGAQSGERRDQISDRISETATMPKSAAEASAQLEGSGGPSVVPKIDSTSLKPDVHAPLTPENNKAPQPSNPQGKTDTLQVPAGKIPQTITPGKSEGTQSDGVKQPTRAPLSTAADAVPPAIVIDGKRNEVQSPAVKPGVTGGAKAVIPTSKVQTGATKPNAPGNKDDAGNPPGKPTGDARTIKVQTPSSTGSAEFDPRQGKPRAVKQTDGREPGAEKPPKSPSSIEPPAKVPGARTNATEIGQTRIASGKTDSKQPAAESSVKTVSGIKSGGGQSDASTSVGQKSRGDEGKRGLIDGQRAQVNDGGFRGVIDGQKPHGMEGGGRVSSDGRKSQTTDGGKRGLVNAEHQPASKFGPLDAAPVGIRRGLAGIRSANSPTEVKAEKGFVSNGSRGNSEAGTGGKRGSGFGPGGAKRADGGINQEVKQGSPRIGDASSGRRPQMEGARIDVGNVRAEGQTGRAARAEAVSGHSNSGRAHGADSPRTEAKIEPGKVGSALGEIIKTNVTGVKYGANEGAKAGTGEGLKGGAASSKGSGARETVNSGKSESAEGGKAPSPKGDKAQSPMGDKAQSPTGDKAQSPKSDPADFVKNPATESVRHGLINAGKQGQRVPPERTVVGGVVDASTPKTPGEGSTRRVSADGTTKKGPAEVPSKKGPFELAPGSLEPKPNLTERPKPPAALPQAENPHGIVRGDKFTAKPLSPAKQPLEPGKPLATKGDGRGFEVPLRGVRNALGDLGQKLIEKISRTLGEVKADAAKSQTVKLVYGLELARVLTAALKAGAQRADVLGGNPQPPKGDAPQRRPVVDAPQRGPAVDAPQRRSIDDTPQRGPAGDAPQRRAVGDGARERRPLIDASSRAEMQLNAANTLTVTRLVPKGVREIPVSDRAIDKIKLTSRLETPTVRATALHRLETAAINAQTVPVIDRAHRAVEIRTQAPPTEARLQNPLETRATPAIEAHTVRVEQSEFRPMTGRPDTADGATKGFNRLQPQVNEQASEKPKVKDARPRRREGEPADGRHKGEAPRHIRDVFLKFNISIPKRSFHPAITDSGSYVALDDVSSQRLNTFISSGTHKALNSETEFARRSNRSGWLADATADQETGKSDGTENNAAATDQAANVKSQDEKQLAKNVQAGTAGDTARKVYIVQAGDTSESIALTQLHDHHLASLIESVNEPLLQTVFDTQKNLHVKVLPLGAMILLPNSRDINAFRERT